MVDIQIVPTPSPRPEAVTNGAPASQAGDSGFALWAGLAWQNTAWPIAEAPQSGTAVEADPLAAWMEEQQGFSSQFAPAAPDPMDALPRLEPAADTPALPTETAAPPEPAALPFAPIPQATVPVGRPEPDGPMPDEGAIASTVQPSAPELSGPAAAPVAGSSAGTSLANTAAAPPVLPVEAQPRDRRPSAPDTAQRQGVAPPTAMPTAMAGQAGRPIAPTASTEPETRQAAPERTATSAPSPAQAPAQAPADPVASAREMATPARAEPPLLTGLAASLADLAAAPQPGAEPTGPRLMPTGGHATGGTALPTATQDPRPVLQQVTEALVTTRGDRIEIALSPEELGRLRLVMSGPDRSHVVIWAERPETLELVRRNADLLALQLAEAGVDSGTMEFRHDDRPDRQDRATGGSAGEDDTVTPVATAIRLSQAPLSDRRVDIRL